MGAAEIYIIGTLGPPVGSALTTEYRKRKSVLRKCCANDWRQMHDPTAMVFDETGRAIRFREMHQVPQLALPVRHIATPPHLVKMT